MSDDRSSSVPIEYTGAVKYLNDLRQRHPAFAMYHPDPVEALQETVGKTLSTSEELFEKLKYATSLMRDVIRLSPSEDPGVTPEQGTDAWNALRVIWFLQEKIDANLKLLQERTLSLQKLLEPKRKGPYVRKGIVTPSGTGDPDIDKGGQGIG